MLLALCSIVGDSALFASAQLPSVSGLTGPSGDTGFQHTVVLFGAALASGWPWATALHSLSSVRRGSFYNEGRGFMTSYGLQLPSERVLREEGSMATISTRKTVVPQSPFGLTRLALFFLHAPRRYGCAALPARPEAPPPCSPALVTRW